MTSPQVTIIKARSLAISNEMVLNLLRQLPAEQIGFEIPATAAVVGGRVVGESQGLYGLGFEFIIADENFPEIEFPEPRTGSG